MELSYIMRFLAFPSPLLSTTACSRARISATLVISLLALCGSNSGFFTPRYAFSQNIPPFFTGAAFRQRVVVVPNKNLDKIVILVKLSSWEERVGMEMAEE